MLDQNEEKTTALLKRFRNTLDPDIENFLKEKAIRFEKRKWCSTYLIVDLDKLDKGEDFIVEGYFTLSNKVLEISETVSNSQKRKLSNGMTNNNDYMHFILIGQLGKYIDKNQNTYGNTSMNELLSSAFLIIKQAANLIVCSNVLLECKKVSELEPDGNDRRKLHEMYQNAGFHPLQESDDYIQYYFTIK